MSLNNTNQNNKRPDAYNSSTANLNSGNNGNNSFRNGNNTKESNVSVKSLFKESVNSTSQRSGSANSIITNINKELSPNKTLITSLLRLNQQR